MSVACGLGKTRFVKVVVDALRPGHPTVAVVYARQAERPNAAVSRASSRPAHHRYDDRHEVE